MRYRGVNYDTGVRFVPQRLSRETFDLDVVRYEIETISERLHCNAVRIVGDDIGRIAAVADLASQAGLAVFFNPWLIDRGEAELLPYLAQAAREAERIREMGTSDICFVLGCELTLFMCGLVPGDSLYERIDWFVARRHDAESASAFAQTNERLADLLERAADTVRREFGGPLTYASGSWEQVDWDLFDFVSVDYYRAEQTAEEYAEGLRALTARGKPVVITEFGCCTYEGADKRGGLGWTVLDEWPEGGPRWRVDEPPARSEQTQARYLTDQLDIITAEDVEGAFVFTFVAPYLPHSLDPQRDFDRSSYALVKTAAAGDECSREVPPWEPKASFYALGEYFQRLDLRTAPAGA